jgi:hypothetical protein
LTDVSAIVAGDIRQGDYFYLLPKQDNLIVCVLKLRTAREKNVCDARRASKPFGLGPCAKAEVLTLKPTAFLLQPKA